MPASDLSAIRGGKLGRQRAVSGCSDGRNLHTAHEEPSDSFSSGQPHDPSHGKLPDAACPGPYERAMLQHFGMDDIREEECAQGPWSRSGNLPEHGIALLTCADYGIAQHGL